jgi:hypothetical protein
MNLYESKQFYLNVYHIIWSKSLHEYLHDFLFSKSFHLFRIYTNLCEYILNLYEVMHTATLLHMVALLDSHTLLRTAAHCHVHCRTATHRRKHCRTLPRDLNLNSTNWYKWDITLWSSFPIYVNLYEFMRIYVNLYEFTYGLRGYPAVRQCAAIRAAVCGSARGSMRQCAW